MTVDIINERFRSQNPSSAQEEQHILREILQEVALFALFRAGFFKEGIFHGGTSLRILHGLRRFSEDLDFILKKPNLDFSWARFETALRDEFAVFSIDLEFLDRGSIRPVQALWLKDQSLGKILQLKHPFRANQKISVKLELDTNPPEGSQFQTKYVDFPVPFSLLAQDLTSGFAGKLHAILCRTYTKGRDWFDLTWYVGRGVKPNLVLLKNALEQQGPWAGTSIAIDNHWVAQALRTKIATVDIDHVKSDVTRFLGEPERSGLSVWSRDYFNHVADKLS